MSERKKLALTIQEIVGMILGLLGSLFTLYKQLVGKIDRKADKDEMEAIAGRIFERMDKSEHKQDTVHDKLDSKLDDMTTSSATHRALVGERLASIETKLNHT